MRNGGGWKVKRNGKGRDRKKRERKLSRMQ